MSGQDVKAVPASRRPSVTQAAGPAAKKRKVQPGGGHPRTGKPIVVAPEHAQMFGGKPMITQYIMTPAPPTAALSNTAYFPFIIERDGVGMIEEATLRFNIQFSTVGDVASTNNAILPVYQWFERIEYIDRMTGEEIGRVQGDVASWLINSMSQESLRSWGEMANVNVKTGQPYTRQIDTTGAPREQYYYWPLSKHWIDGAELDLNFLKNDLEIRFYPRGDIFLEPQAGLAAPCTVLLTELRLIAQTQMNPRGERLHMSDEKRMKVFQHNFLDWQRYVDYGRVMTNSTEYKFDLDQFHHDSAFLIIAFRKSSAATVGPTDAKATDLGGVSATENLFKFHALGDRATIDHENVHGRSLYGDGTPVDEQFFRKQISDELWNAEFAECNYLYLMPFSHDAHKALDGERDGFHRFRGHRERLAIRTSDVSVPTSWNLRAQNEDEVPSDWIGTTTNRLKVFYEGELVYASGLFDGTAAASPALFNAAAEINKSPAMRSKCCQIYLSSVGALTAGSIHNASNIVFELYDNAWQPKILLADAYKGTAVPIQQTPGEIGKWSITLSDNNGVQPPFTSRAPNGYVPGRRGFLPGTYDVNIYSGYYRHTFEQNGQIEVYQDHA